MGLFLLYGKIIMRNKSLAGRANNRAERPRKVAIYIRVSTTHQIDKDSLPMQRKDLIAYCELILGIEDYEIFEDAGYSGKNTDGSLSNESCDALRNDAENTCRLILPFTCLEDRPYLS